MDSMAQIDGGSSKPFWIIRYKKVVYKQKRCRANYRLPKYSTIDLQIIFGDDFYTNPIKKTPPKPPEPSESSKHLKIQFKKT